jgi:hypothetical protein
LTSLQSKEALLAEADRLEQSGLERVRSLALSKALNSYESCYPDSFAAAFTPPADAVYAAFQRLVNDDSPLKQYVRSAEVPSVGGWYESCPELIRAGQLRQAAFTAAEYPTQVCRSCHRLSGWLATDSRCDYCLWAEQISAMMAKGSIFRWHEHGECMTLSGRYDQAALVEYRDVRRGPGATWWPFWPLGRFGQKRHEQEKALAWSKVVHDLLTDWGPKEPKDGYALWIPERFELEAMDGSTLLLHFRATRYFWQSGCFVRLYKHLPHADFVEPLCFAADLAPAPLAAAWHDFRLSVAKHNRREWQEQIEDTRQLEQAAAAEAARLALIQEQRGAASLLEV